MFALAVHGGAGGCRPEQAETVLAGVRAALEAGGAVLTAGGSALDAAVAAVVVLEDDPAFNAGTGSALNLDGSVEMDAGVMVSAGLRSGNVAALRRVKNPILVARAVMEQTDHVLLAGEGALHFARAIGMADHDPITPERRAGWERAREGMQRVGDHYLSRMHGLLDRYPELARGTVGAVARDVNGVLAAATSTGGVTLKLPGRVGDTPVPGAGNYADNHAAVSATGRGELMLRALTALRVCDAVASGDEAQGAVDAVMAWMSANVGDDLGLISVDYGGRIGIAHFTPAMPHGWLREGEQPIARIAYKH